MNLHIRVGARITSVRFESTGSNSDSVPKFLDHVLRQHTKRALRLKDLQRSTLLCHDQNRRPKACLLYRYASQFAQELRQPQQMLLILHLPLFELALLDAYDISRLDEAPRALFLFRDAEVRCSPKPHLLECSALTAPTIELQGLVVRQHSTLRDNGRGMGTAVLNSGLCGFFLVNCERIRLVSPYHFRLRDNSRPLQCAPQDSSRRTCNV